MRRHSRARAVVEAARPSPSIAAAGPSSSTAAAASVPPPPPVPELTYLLVQHLLRFMVHFERRVMRRLDRLDQVFASQGIELPPLLDSPASDKQDQEEEHSEELTQQEAPSETQTTTEVQHDIPEPQPVPPPVPQPEPEHEPQPGAIVDLHPELQ
nr:protein TsetseEP-like [Arachis hypogaea]